MTTEQLMPEPVPEELTDLAKFDATEVGQTGLRQSSGYIDEEFLAPLKGPKAAKVYRQMTDNDPVVGAIRFAVNMMIRQVDFRLEKADDSEKAQEFADLMRGMLFEDMATTWSDVVTEICTMFDFGYAPMEVVLKQRKGRRKGPRRPGTVDSKFDDGYMGIHKIALRAQESIHRWQLSPQGDIEGLVQQPENGPQIPIPIDRFLLFRTQAVKNNPEGRSIYRNAYRPWFFKTRHEEVEAVGAERDLGGYPLMYLPSEWFLNSATPEQKRSLATYRTLLANIRRDKSEGVCLPGQMDANGNRIYELSLIASASTRTVDSDKIIGRYAREIAMTVLADFIFLGQKSVGSFALSSDKTELFSTALGGFLQRICEPFNTVLIPEIWRVNGFDYDLMPTLCHGDIESVGLTEVCALIDTMVGAGVTLFPDRELENVLRKLAGLPEAPDMGDDEEAAEIRRNNALYGHPQGEEGKAAEREAEVETAVAIAAAKAPADPAAGKPIKAKTPADPKSQKPAAKKPAKAPA